MNVVVLRGLLLGGLGDRFARDPGEARAEVPVGAGHGMSAPKPFRIAVPDAVIADLEEREGERALVFEGKEVRFPVGAARELEACFEREEPFRMAELPGELDESGRLVLVRRLVREGFLRIVSD